MFLIEQFSIKSAALLQLKDAAEICFCKCDTEIKCISFKCTELEISYSAQTTVPKSRKFLLLKTNTFSLSVDKIYVKMSVFPTNIKLIVNQLSSK